MRVLPPGAVTRTDAEDGIFLSSSYGLKPDSWQQDLLFDWLSRNKLGKWAASTCWLAVPRQNGKNGVIEMRELYGMVLLGEKFLHTAHEVKTARKAFKRLKTFFGDQANDPNARYPELNALVREVRSTNGQEAIVLHAVDCKVRTEGAGCNCTDGPSVEFVARSKGSGRGFTVDVLVLDEAQDLTDEEFEALKPTISSAPLRNPQTIIVGTPPDPDRKNQACGEVFVRIRNRGLKGESGRLTLTDFGAPDGPLPDIYDRKLLIATNPAIESGRLNLESCEDERDDGMSPEGYARERLGWWGDPDTAAGTAFGEGFWETCFDEDLVGFVPATCDAIGLSASLDRLKGAISAAWMNGADVEVGVLDIRDGVGWIVPEAKRLQATYGCAVVIDEKGPLADLIPALEAAGVDLTKLNTPELLDETAAMYDRVHEGKLRHGNHEELNQSIRSAKQRGVGKRWLFGRRTPSSDISVLESALLAVAGATSAAYDVLDTIY